VTEKPSEVYLDPATSTPLPPRVPGGAALEITPGSDPREAVMAWMLERDNPFFVPAIMNRIWEHYLGRGLIDPVDALSGANPPSHPELLAELGQAFVDSGYDLRALHRRILRTAAYQRSWRTNPTNVHDEQTYSRRILRRLSAEQAVEVIATATGTRPNLTKRFAEFDPAGRVVEIASSRLGGDDAYVLTIFGKPLRTQNCDCERSPAASLSQALYLFNDEKLQAKLSDPKGRVAELLKNVSDDRRAIEELFLATVARPPTVEETDRFVNHVATSPSRAAGLEDVVWALLNSDEFITNH
jgi:hypothetical protein